MDALRTGGSTARRRFGPFMLDPVRGELTRDGAAVALRPKTYALLVYLVDRAGSVVPKQELLDAVWPGLVVTDDSLTQAISELRSALGEHGPALIRTLSRRGYRFEAELLPAERPAPASPPAPAAAAAAPPASRPAHWAVRTMAAVIGATFVALLWLGVTQLRAQRLPLDEALAQSRSIVITPFADLSSPPAPQLAFAVDDELATDLGRHADLRVIARGSAAALGEAVTAQQAGRELKVRHLLAGSVQQLGNSVSISVRLLRTDDGRLLWSERFEYPSIADWAQRREISARIANLLGTRITLAAVADGRRPPQNHEALDHWMRGRFILYRLPQRAELPQAKAELMQARSHFEAALASDPESIQAIAGLSFTYVNEVIYRWSADRKATLATAAELARRALAIDPNDITALKALAGAQLFDGDLDGAMRTARRQLEINPSDAHARRDLAGTLHFQGQWDAALHELDLAERLNPLDPSHLDKVHGMAGFALIALGRYEEAIARARRLEAVTPHSASPYLYLAASHAHLGRQEEARQAAAEVLRRRPQFMIGADARRASTAPAYLDGVRHMEEGLRLAGLPERPASAPR